MSHRSHRRRRGKLLLPLLILVLLAVILVLVIAFRTDSGDSSPDPQDTASASSDPNTSETSEPSATIPVETTQPSEPVSDPVNESEIPWYLTLVNASHPLPEDFTVKTTALPSGLGYDSRAYAALIEMLDACRADGLEPLVCSAYRTVARQTELFENKINKYLADGLSYDEAYASASTVVAIPGTSEHNLGLAVDICALSYQLLNKEQENTPEQKWLMAHCHEYGFILRYPNNKTDITGIIYEPWHYRYVGKEAAAEIMSSGICFEEYMELHYGID